MSWTEEKVKKLKELWGKGNTASQIAEIIKIIILLVTAANIIANVTSAADKGAIKVSTILP